jgi:hypothetical protein
VYLVYYCFTLFSFALSLSRSLALSLARTLTYVSTPHPTPTSLDTVFHVVSSSRSRLSSSPLVSYFLSRPFSLVIYVCLSMSFGVLILSRFCCGVYLSIFFSKITMTCSFFASRVQSYLSMPTYASVTHTTFPFSMKINDNVLSKVFIFTSV